MVVACSVCERLRIKSLADARQAEGIVELGVRALFPAVVNLTTCVAETIQERLAGMHAVGVDCDGYSAKTAQN
jgi:hypothetical protein